MVKVPMETPGDESIMDTLHSYSRFYWCQMRGQGFQVELGDVEGELGVVYAQALRGYNTQSPAAFGTYLHKAFENRISTIKKALAKSWSMPVFPLAGGDIVDPDTIEDGVGAIDQQDALKRYSEALTGSQKIIFDEMANPSEAVMAHMRTSKGVSSNGSQIAAICAVHGLKRRAVYEVLKNLKEQKYYLTKVQ